MTTLKNACKVQAIAEGRCSATTTESDPATDDGVVVLLALSLHFRSEVGRREAIGWQKKSRDIKIKFASRNGTATRVFKDGSVDDFSKRSPLFIENAPFYAQRLPICPGRALKSAPGHLR